MRYSLASLLGLLCINAQANVIQYFTGISYSNPAELFTIKKNEFLIGGTGFHTNARFQGTVLNFNNGQYGQGTSYSRTTSFLPYGRLATRINDKAVFSVDVTQPFHSNLNWGNQSFTRYAATQTYLTDVEVSPRLSYSITPKFYVGGGLNFNFLKNNETNWALPVGPITSANLVNRTAGFGVGYNLGGYYLINPSNFLGLVYYSVIKQNTRGSSQLQNSINNSLAFNFSMPATSVLSYVHLFSPTWLTNIKVYYSEWDANQYAIFRNTSAPPPLNQDFSFTMRFKKSLAYLAAVRHQWNKSLGITAVGMLDNGPERDEFRTINFPADTQYFLGLVADYHFNEQTSIELLYGYGFSKTIMDNHIDMNNQTIPFTTGRVRIYANVVDLKLKIQV